MKNRLMFFLLLLALLLSVAGCGGRKNEENTIPSNSDTEATAQLELVSDKTAHFTVVLSKDASDLTVDSICNFTDKIKSSYAIKSPISVVHDGKATDENTDAEAIELIVGKTSRKISGELLETVGESGWGIKVSGSKVAIAATDDAFLPSALYWFTDNLVDRKTAKLAIDADFIKTEKVTPMSESSYSEILAQRSIAIAFESDKLYTATPYDGHNAGQGACTDGEYLYVSLLKILNYDAGEFDVAIKKIRLSDMQVVGVSQSLSLDHCNDLCYNADTGEIIAVNMSGAIFTVIDPETLTVKRSFELTQGGSPYCLDYDAENDRYVTITNGQIYSLDSSFKTVARTERYMNSSYTAQGIHCDSEYIYMPMSMKESAGTEDNIILVFDWEFNYLGEINVASTTDELQTLFTLDGELYAVYNNKNPSGGGAVISKLTLHQIYK